MIKNILFDLDGTMLPMDQEEFIKVYFTEVCNRFCPVLNMEQDMLIKGIWKGTAAMIKNDRSMLNIEAFWRTFAKVCGKEVISHKDEFDDFYTKEFFKTKDICTFNPLVPEIINTLKNKGYNLVTATNPIFPSVATFNRIKWAGLNPKDFSLITTYDNSSSGKPNPLYYQEILEKIKAQPDECMMVGNDVAEDILPTKELGMDNYLITDCLINKDDVDLSPFKTGIMRDFLNLARTMPDAK